MYRVRTTFTGTPGAPYLSTMYFDEPGGSAQQAATAVGTFWGAMDADISNSINWATEAEVAIVNEETGQVTSATNTTPVIGTGAEAGQQLPRATQGLVRWFTGVFQGGRQIRGRTFIPGLTETDSITDGLPSPAWMATTDAAAAALIAEVNADLVTWSRTLGVAHPVVGGTTWGDFAVLRSRRD